MESKKQDWSERVTSEIAELRMAKFNAQNLYYKLRKDGLSHALALAAVVDFLMEIKLAR